MMCTIYRVHPTGVGMIRLRTAIKLYEIGSSHRRGNDSSLLRSQPGTSGFIPQAWE